MTYEHALALLAGRLNYESRGMPDQAELRVDRTALLLERLGRPHDRLPIIHVAGTKGKGSTANMIARLLEESGLRIGLHTSPHLLRVEERFRIGSETISADLFARTIGEIWPEVEEVDRLLPAPQTELTYFEITTALTLLYFAREHVDAAVIEVGMGGRLDSTNVVDPVVSVITSISFDHMKQLGRTLPQIAGEKAGIIKPARPIVTAVTEPESLAVIERRARDLDSRLYRLGRDFDYQCRSVGLRGEEVDVRIGDRSHALRLGAVGLHQASNAATALMTVDVFLKTMRPSEPLPAGESLASLRIPGRFEILHRDPLVVFDVGHNTASFEAISRTLKGFLPERHRGRRVLLFATSRDKEADQMLAAVGGLFTDVILTEYRSNPRALPADELSADWVSAGTRVHFADQPASAWELARRLLDRPDLSLAGSHPEGPPAVNTNEGLVLAAGSFFLIAELLDLTGARPLPLAP